MCLYLNKISLEIFIKKNNIGCIWEEQLSGWGKKGERFPFFTLKF